METECASCEERPRLKVLLQVASISQLTVSRLCGHCGILNISQTYRPPRPVTGIVLLFNSRSTVRSAYIFGVWGEIVDDEWCLKQ
jgi:hypothetical protein